MATPVTPSRITATAMTTKSIQVLWSSSGLNTAYYYLERSTNGGSTWTRINILPVSRTSYDDVNLTPGSQYCYRVRGANATETGLYSSTVCTTTLAALPSPGSEGQILETVSSAWAAASFDWDSIAAATASDMVHDHSANGEGGKLAQANTHESPDTDAATTSLHHTLGTGANQAAAGNHTHASSGEVLMADGITPPDPLTTEDQTDWLYEG